MNLFQLRDSCWCTICRTNSGQRKTNITHDIKSIKIKKQTYFYDKGEIKQLFITWEDGHKSLYNYENLIMENCKPIGHKFIDEPKEKIDDKYLLEYKMNGYTVIDQSLEEYKKYILKYFYPMKTIYSEKDDFWNVREITDNTCKNTCKDICKNTCKDTAYTTQHLDPHTDCTYMTEPPALISFNCIKRADNGGDTLIVDSKDIINELSDDDIQYFSTKKLNWFSKTTKHNLQHRSPIISDVFRFNHYDFSANIDYNRYLKLNNIIKNKTKKISLHNNQTILINNHRMLHGRTGFFGSRHLFGCYVELNLVNSILRKI